MTEKELKIARNLGKQVAKGNILYCPYCKEESTLEYNNENDQDLSSFGDYEETLFCPHCELTVELAVKLVW